ncbi:hypothetical protein V8G54_031127 [Vigna mungo]|uniref:Uncharacterized protein n=1 Tax=Vigna mungo TaxID=3915 RepID=A0AAQ3MXK9_VIGMU
MNLICKKYSSRIVGMRVSFVYRIHCVCPESLCICLLARMSHMLATTSLPPAANIEQRPTVATHLSVLTSHIFTVPSWDAVNTRSPESVPTQLTGPSWPLSSSSS